MTYEWSQEDVESYCTLCTALDMKDRTTLLKVWSNESNLDPTAHNPNGNASGVAQWMPETLKALGYDLAKDPTLAAFRALTVAQQLRWAAAYYAPMRRCLGTVAGAYAATFLPAVADHGDDPSYVLCALGGQFSWAYAANPAFDTAHKGTITMADLTAAAERAWGPRAQDIAARVARAADTEPDLPPVPASVPPVDLGPAGDVTEPAT